MVQRYASPLSDALLVYRQRLATNVVLANVVFGQSSLGCRGNGLCRVDLVTSQYADQRDREKASGESCQRVLVTFCHDEAGLRMIIPVEQLSDQTLRQHFSEASFSVNEAHSFSEKMASTLQLEDRVVAKGLYAMQKEPLFITVFLKQNQ